MHLKSIHVKHVFFSPSASPLCEKANIEYRVSKMFEQADTNLSYSLSLTDLLCKKASVNLLLNGPEEKNNLWFLALLEQQGV